MVEGQRMPIRYWIDARAHIFERQVLLFVYLFVCFLYNQRRGVILESLKKITPSRFSPLFSFFGVRMLFGNFGLEPIRLPKFLCLDVFLH